MQGSALNLSNGAQLPIAAAQHQQNVAQQAAQLVIEKSAIEATHRSPGATPTRDKRLVTELIIGTFSSNVLTSILDHLWKPDSLEQILWVAKKLDAQLRSLDRRQNFTELQVLALREAGQLTAQLVEHNVGQVTIMQSVYPQLVVVSGNVLEKIHLL